jgi:hypothetical protein
MCLNMSNREVLRLDETDQMLAEELMLTAADMAENPEQSAHYMHLVMDLLSEELDIPREELQDPEIQEVIRGQFEKLGMEAQELLAEYEADVLLAEWTFSNLERFRETVEVKKQELDMQKKKSEFEGILGVEVDSIETDLESENNYSLRFRLNGVDVAVKTYNQNNEYGSTSVLEYVKLDGNEVKLIGNFFRRSLGALNKMAENYIEFKETVLSAYPELADKKLHYQDSIFIAVSSPEELGDAAVPYVVEEEMDGVSINTYYRADRSVILTELSIGSDVICDIFDEQGERILLYPEWLSANELENNKVTQERYINEYLAPALEDPELFDRFFKKKMCYTSDDVVVSAQIDNIPKISDSTSSSGARDTKERWQTWGQTIQREHAGAYLGDCDDYAALAEKIWEAQGKENVFVLLIPQHATTIQVTQNEDGSVTVSDIGTFDLFSVTAPTIEKAMQGVYDRYQSTGMGVWQGQNLVFDPNKIEIQSIMSADDTSFHAGVCLVSIDELLDPKKMEVLMDIEDDIFEENYSRALEKIGALPDEEKKREVIQYLVVTCHCKLDGWENSKPLVQEFLDKFGKDTQEDYELFLNQEESLEAKQDIVRMMAEELGTFRLSRAMFQVLFNVIYLPSNNGFELAYELRNSIDEADRIKYFVLLLKTSSVGYNSDERFLQALRELLDSIETSKEIDAGSKDNLIPVMSRDDIFFMAGHYLPLEEKANYAAKFMENDPSDSFATNLFIDNLIESEKYDLAIYLVLSGEFDEILSKDAKYFLLGKCYLATKNYPQIIESISGNLPTEQAFRMDEGAVGKQRGLFEMLQEGYLRSAPEEGADYYHSLIEEQDPVYEIYASYIVRAWVQCRYKNKKITLSSVKSDVEDLRALSDNKTLQHYYFKNLFRILGKRKMRILRYMRNELTQINEEVDAEHGPQKSTGEINVFGTDEKSLAVKYGEYNTVERLILMVDKELLLRP